MNDLISRQAVIDAIRSMDRNDHIDEYTENVVEYFKNMPSAEKTANKININEYVKVKLTDYGKEIFYHQYDNLNKTYGKEIIKPSYPTVDSDGYTSFQLWYFMNLYGRHIDMGVKNVIEPLEIVFESAEKTAEWISHKEDDLAINDYQCSKCDYWTEYNTKYCPNCGRKMKGAEEE